MGDHNGLPLRDKRVALTVRRSFPVYPNKPTFAEPVGTSQRSMNRRQPTPGTGQSRATAALSREPGKVVLDGTAGALRDREDVREFYLGGTGHQRKNLKRFKRRKRWL
jgi:hypothetical protein